MKTTRMITMIGAIALAVSLTAAYGTAVPKSAFLKNEPGTNRSADGSFGCAATRAHGPIDHYQTQTDRSTTQAIRGAIFDDPTLDRAYNNITITTVKGHVMLKGEVSTKSERDEVQSVARKFVKSKKIANDIVVSSSLGSNEVSEPSERGPALVGYVQTDAEHL